MSVLDKQLAVGQMADIRYSNGRGKVTIEQQAQQVKAKGVSGPS